jgi:uncharacterized membrane protein
MEFAGRTARRRSQPIPMTVSSWRLAEIDYVSARNTRRIMRWFMSAFYLLAGVFHLTTPDPFLLIVPDWVAYPREVVLLTGACEIAGAVALLTSRLRWWAGVMLALYAVCVFPANLKHAFMGVHVSPLPDSWWYHGPRLAFQPVLVLWALFCAGVIDWPVHITKRRPT